MHDIAALLGDYCGLKRRREQMGALALRMDRLWRDDRRLRLILLVIDVGLIAFWLYSIMYVMHHPAEKGSDGFEILAAVPMTGIAIGLSVPALLLLVWKRTLRIGVWVTLAAIVINIWCWSYILLYAGLGRPWAGLW